MCGEPGSTGEGWLRKRSHHVGAWNWRYFKFDSKDLKYWKNRTSYCKGQRPRAVLKVAGNQVVANGDLEIVIAAANKLDNRFDEELLAKDERERDAWVRCLSGATHQYRLELKDSQVSAQRCLTAKGHWPILESAVASSLGFGVGRTESVPEDSVTSLHSSSVTEAILAHCRYDSVLLQFSQAALKPRQGRLVTAARKMSRKNRKGGAATAEAREERWLVLMSARPLYQGAPVNNRLVSHLPEPEELDIAFEQLHAYADPLDAAGPILSLPLLHCKIFPVCEDGHYWSIKIEEEDPAGTTGAERTWTLLVETQEAADSWRHAIAIACKAAQARHQGLKRTVEETLEGYLVDPTAWMNSMAESLEDVRRTFSNDSVLSVTSCGSWHSQSGVARLSSSNGPPEMRGMSEKDAAMQALDQVLEVCEEVWSEACDVLAAALQVVPEKEKLITTVEVKEGKSLDPSQIPDGPDSIAKAWYGKEDSMWVDGGSDVTEKVKELLRTHQPLKANNTNFGDPAPLRVKSLAIQLKADANDVTVALMHGEQIPISLEEGDTIFDLRQALQKKRPPPATHFYKIVRVESTTVLEDTDKVEQHGKEFSAILEEVTVEGNWDEGYIVGTSLRWKNGTATTIEKITPRKFTVPLGDDNILLAVLEADGKLHWSDGDLWERVERSPVPQGATTTILSSEGLRRIRRDVCEAVLNAAIDPALVCVGRCWERWNPVFTQTETRKLLLWLVKCQKRLHSLGVVFPPLDQAISGISAYLGLQMGRHLRRFTRQLLVTELRGWSPTNSAGSRPEALDLRSLIKSNLPVDFFYMANACLAADVGQEVLVLRMCSQRVAKFMVYELQEVLLGWLFETQKDCYSDLFDKRYSRGLSSTPSLSSRVRQWLATAVGLTNSFPEFLEQCQLLNFTPVFSEQSTSSTNSVMDPLRREALPREWCLEAEMKRFAALTDGFLWAICDVIAARWRCAVLAEPPALVDGIAPNRSPSISILLKSYLDEPLQVLRNVLEVSVFKRILPMLFKLCLACYLLRLLRESWFKTMKTPSPVAPPQQSRNPDAQKSQLSEEANKLCLYFRNLAAEVSGSTNSVSGPWQTGRAYEWLVAVWSSPAKPKFQGLPAEEEIKRLLEVMLAGLKSGGSLKPAPLSLRHLLNSNKALGDHFDDISENLFVDTCTYRKRPPATRRTAVQAVPAEAAAVRSVIMDAPERDRRRSSSGPMLPAKLFGAGRRPSSAGSRPQADVLPQAVAVPVPVQSIAPAESMRISIASLGEAFEEKIENSGMFGISCSILRQEAEEFQGRGERRPSSLSHVSEKRPSLCSQDSSPRSASDFGDCCPSKNANIWTDAYYPVRRRWIQLVRDQPPSKPAGSNQANLQRQDTGRFEILRSCNPSDPAAQESSLLERFSLSQLEDVYLPDGETTMLHLTFSKEIGVVVHFALLFDSPLHLLRMRIILEAWTSHDIDEHRPVVVLSTDTSNKPSREVAAGSWGVFPGPLTRNVLNGSLGTLWNEVRETLRHSSIDETRKR